MLVYSCVGCDRLFLYNIFWISLQVGLNWIQISLYVDLLEYVKIYGGNIQEFSIDYRMRSNVNVI